ncbi:DNA double-strand break repair helicase HerA [uncultured archaeon]|nr:DNA double-strand break repair helicase HerA [uncultured archaeon]
MKPIGTVITTEESPSTSEFAFVFDPNERNVKKGQYVQTDSEQGTVFGYIAEIFRSNRYFERAESVAEYERVSSMKDNFPTTSWEYIIAQVKVLGVSAGSRFARTSIPPVPGAKVFSADEELLKSFLGLKENGLLLGKIQHHATEARLDLTRLIQKHLAILAMSGAGKSHLSTVLIEELLDRKKEDGRIAVVVIDIHGEYMGFADSPYANRTKMIEVGNRKHGFTYPFRKVTPEMVEEWLPMLSFAQKALLRNVLMELHSEHKKTRKPYGFKDLMARIDEYQQENSKSDKTVKPALKRTLKELQRMRFLSENKENPKFFEAVKPGHLLIMDFSDVDSLRKKQVIVSMLARKLFNLRRKGRIPPFMLVVEEAHNFAREKAEENEAVSRAVIETIAREGRKFGAALCLITQRPVNLSTTALSQCNTHIILRVTNPNDLDHIEQSSEGIDSRIAKSITSLRTGEGIIVGEATNAPIFVDIRNIKIRKKEKGRPLAELAAEYEKMQEKKDEDAEAFL